MSKPTRPGRHRRQRFVRDRRPRRGRGGRRRHAVRSPERRGRARPARRNDVLFLPRHGRGHRIAPHAINYRANVCALKKLGATHLVSVSAVGSMKEEIAPGDFVVVDQFIDLTKRRVSTFFDDGIVAHVGSPTRCARTSPEALGDRLRRRGRSRCTAAERTSASRGRSSRRRAESRVYRSWGVSVIGMTAMPEAKLAREAELPYALLARDRLRLLARERRGRHGRGRPRRHEEERRRRAPRRRRARAPSPIREEHGDGALPRRHHDGPDASAAARPARLARRPSRALCTEHPRGAVRQARLSPLLVVGSIAFDDLDMPSGSTATSSAGRDVRVARGVAARPRGAHRRRRRHGLSRVAPRGCSARAGSTRRRRAGRGARRSAGTGATRGSREPHDARHAAQRLRRLLARRSRRRTATSAVRPPRQHPPAAPARRARPGRAAPSSSPPTR
jgi:hypothetical protein